VRLAPPNPRSWRPLTRAALCLALGAIHRSKGGLALQPAVPATVDALFAVASRPAGVCPLWPLQALLCVANAAGPGYGPYVNRTLQLCQELLVGGFSRNCLACSCPFSGG
jgi:hypothetical protein